MLKKGFIGGIMACFGLFIAVGSVAAKPLDVTGSATHLTQQITGLDAFESMYVNGQAEVEFVQTDGDKYAVSVSGPENLVALAHISVDGATLNIRYKQPLAIEGDAHLQVSVFAPILTEIEVAEAGEVSVPGPLHAKQLRLQTRGKGEIDLAAVQSDSLRVHTEGESEINIEDLSCGYLQAAVLQKSSFETDRTACDMVLAQASNRASLFLTGLSAQSMQVQSTDSADIKLKGYAQKTSLTARNHSGIHAGGLQSEQAEVMAENSAHIDVRVSDTLSAQTQGKGEVQYRGWPKHVKRLGKQGSVYPNK